MRFNNRIFELEIMDQEDLSTVELRKAYKDINRSNYMLGGYRATYRSLLHLCRQKSSKEISLIDIGCGEGGMMRYLADKFRKKGYRIDFYGLDLNKQAIELAIQNSKEYPEIEYHHGNILDTEMKLPKCDYVTSTLTMHHFPDEDIPDFITRCGDFAEKAVVINDLHRSKLAYYLFKIFSAIFIRSAIARNDGLISIRKGFSRNELTVFSKQLIDYSHLIQWKWAFRYVWVMECRRLKNNERNTD